MKRAKTTFLLLLVLVLISGASANEPGSCSNTRIQHDTHHHGDGTSGSVAYQDWHVRFQGYRTLNRGRDTRGCGGNKQPTNIYISDDDGNSVSESNPGENYRVSTSDYSWLEGGDDVTVYFTSDNGATSSSVTRTMPIADDPPTFSNPEPDDGDLVGSGTVNLNVDTSDPDSDSLDVYFRDASDGSLIGSETVSSGGTASTDWNVDEGQTYNWYVVVEDDVNSVDNSGSPWSFTTNSPPTVSDPNPSDDAIITDTTPDISVEYNDADGDDGTVTFYESDGTTIDSCAVSNGNRCGVEWSSADHGDNPWYAIASDGTGILPGPSWSFAINQHPNQASVVEPADGATVYGESVEIEAEVSDPDGDSLDVEFFNNVSNLSSSERTVSGVNSGESTSVTVDNINRGRSYRWWVKTSDSWESTKGGSWTFYNNELPSVSNPSPPDDGVAVNQDVSISILPEDKESTAGNELRAYFYEGNGVFIQEIDATNGDTVSIEYPNTEIGETYEWYVKLSDGYENYTSSVFEFEKTTTGQYRVEPSIDYKYSDILIAQDGSEEFFFEVQNRISDSKDLKTYISGANATFRDNNQDSISYSLDGYETRSFLVRIDPETTGDKTLALITENQQFGVNTTTEIPITIKNYNDVSQTSEVPGIGFLQMVVILAISSTVYLARIQ